MVGALEVPGIITGPQTLASGFARLATFRFAAITLRLGITIVREEELFATPAQPFSDALHDPVPPGQECNIRNRQGRRGLNAGRRLKNHRIFSDYEEKKEAEEKAFSRRHSGGTFRPPVTIKENTHKTVIRENAVNADSIVFYDQIVLLGTKGVNQTKKELRLVGYRIDGKDYWIATNRYDLTAEEVAQVYKLRWNIESFFGWWKRHLKVYHLIARSKYGLMVQILGGLITYLLLAIYCREQHQEPVSIARVRELRNQIENEAAAEQKQQTNVANQTKSGG